MSGVEEVNQGCGLMRSSDRPRFDNNKHGRLQPMRQIQSSLELRRQCFLRIWVRKESGRKYGWAILQVGL